MSTRWKQYLEKNSLMILLLSLFLGGALRWLQIGTHSFWYDEALSGLIAGLSVSQIISNAAGTDHPPGYYLLLHFWSGLGRSEMMLRSLSALFSVGAIALLYGLGRWLFDRATAALAALGLAIFPFQIYFAQETRMYGLIIFLAIAVTWVFLYAIRNGRSWLPWVGYVILATLGMYTHYYTAFLLVSLHLWLGIYFRKYSAVITRLVVADICIGLLFLPQLGQALTRTQAYLGGVAWQSSPSILSPLTTVYYLLFAHRTPIWLFPISLFLVLVVLVLILWEMRRRPGQSREAELVLWLNLVAPVVIVVAISWLIRPIYVERSFAIGAPALVLLIAHGALAAPRWSPTPFLAILLVIPVGITLALNSISPDPAKPPLREAVRFVEVDFQSRDVSLHLQDASLIPAAWYAPDIEHVLADVPGAAFTTPATHHLFGGDVADWQAALDDADRLWLTVMPGYTGPAQIAVHQEIDRKYPQLMAKDWGAIQVYLYDLEIEP